MHNLEQYSISSSASSFEETENEDEVIEQLSPVPGPSRNKRGRTELLTPRLSATLDRCKISDRDAVHLLTACVEALL